MTTFTGFVARIGHKTGNGSRGPWNLYSVKIEKEDGEEYKDWISLGFRDEPPSIKEGEYITLEAEQDDKGRYTYVDGTARKPKNPPARKARAGSNGGGAGGQNRQGYRGGNGGGGFRGGQKFDGTGIQNRSNPEDVKRMSYANARSAAIEVIALLLEHKALPVSAASGKAAEAKRFDEVLKAIDKLTVEYYHDGVELRKLNTVADAGTVNVAPDAELPAEQKTHDIDDADGADDQAEQGQEDDGDDPAF